VFFSLANIPYFTANILPRYLESHAALAARILRTLGEPADAHGTILASPRFSMNIQRGCDAIDAIALLMAGVLAFRDPWKKKAVGVLAGLAILLTLNMVRVVSLFFIGIKWPKAFEFAHVEAWQVAFIFISLALWVAWALWASRSRHDAAPAGPGAAAVGL